ncbi:DUF4190 domain-containing protein [Streptomyces fragilis]|uniref:DUF4190 domain-containing protein n=1 Tax=Streptomyces fragilis TaxID=67301 RepID=A0ABV2YET9_9ACTN|nr:DUF4190 domain-containing protein [Streptomyces fragilis]
MATEPPTPPPHPGSPDSDGPETGAAPTPPAVSFTKPPATLGDQPSPVEPPTPADAVPTAPAAAVPAAVEPPAPADPAPAGPPPQVPAAPRDLWAPPESSGVPQAPAPPAPTPYPAPPGGAGGFGPPVPAGPHGAGPYPHGPGPYPYGAPAPFGGFAPQKPPYNGLAITALVLGLLCCVPLAGVILGVIALVQIRKKGQRGKGLAVTGIVLSTIGTLFAVLFFTTGGWTAFKGGFEEGLRGAPARSGRATASTGRAAGRAARRRTAGRPTRSTRCRATSPTTVRPSRASTSPTVPTPGRTM